MSDAFTFIVEARDETGTGASRRLRRLHDKVPAVLYGGKEDVAYLQLNHNNVIKALENEAVYSHILTLDIGGKKQKAVLKALHRHPFKSRILHMDFQRITGKEKITMHVPLHFIGEEVAPGAKLHGGIFNHLLIDVEIQCLPDNLPEFISVDVSKLELDQSLHLSDLKLPQGITLTALAHGNDLPVVSIHLPRAAKEEDETATPASAEVPTIASEAAAKKEKE